MSFHVMRCYEYSMRCDKCGAEEVLHTGDYISEMDIFVHNGQTAIKAAKYHRSKGLLLCDECFKKGKRYGIG